MLSELIPGYVLRRGSRLDRALLVKFMQRTYQELYPDRDFSHLAGTVDRYCSHKTPLWWVEPSSNSGEMTVPVPKVGGLWLGNAIDQLGGDRHAHIFLVYVEPEHRRQGIGTALIRHAEAWAKQRGDRQIALQVFVENQPALNLYHKLGYEPLSMWMVKSLEG